MIDDVSRLGELVSRLKWHSYEGYCERVYTVHVTNKIIARCVKRGDVYIWTYIGEHLGKK